MPVEAFPGLHAHPSEDVLEEYVFRRVTGRALSRVEDHLLICSQCQDRLVDVENYISLLKRGLAEFARKPEQSWSVASSPERKRMEGRHRFGGLAILGPRGMFVLSSLALGCMVALTTAALTLNPQPSTERVALTTLRGADPVGAAHAQAGHALDLSLDSSHLPASAANGAYVLQLVDAAGRSEWQGTATATAGAVLTAHVPHRVRAGIYWVRLYSSSGELIREYGLRVE